MYPSEKGTVVANGVEIYYDAFGTRNNPSVVLVIGMDAQCTLWVPEFVEPIVEAGYHVVRFDNRDYGLSEWIGNWQDSSPYTLEDMAADAIGLLDGLGIDRAHFVGSSMGGMIVQRIGISYPDRICTMTSLSSSAFAMDPDPSVWLTSVVKRDLPDHESLIAKYPLYETEADQTVEYRLEALKVFSGSRFPFDETIHRELQVHNVMERKGYNPQAKTHQTAAIVASGSRLEELGRIKAPSLVVHGTEDPLLPPGHAEKCASLIPDARLVLLEGIGHELPFEIMGQVQEEILKLLGRTVGKGR
ncbi:MAG: alpha/beta hydrolase, partial [Proteobacteria bacterium]|nr:alpha/beta hydrolase [Pseudomonadota bacterium]